MWDPLSREAIRQNLIDAGCGTNVIETFFMEFDRGNALAQRWVLIGQRQELLESIHMEQRKLDCLDYLLYQLGKKEETRKK